MKKPINIDLVIKKCVGCKQPQSWEGNMFSRQWVCTNAKCKFYLRRSLPFKISASGKITNYDFVDTNKLTELQKKQAHFWPGVILFFILLFGTFVMGYVMYSAIGGN